MKPVTIYVSESVYEEYQDKALRSGTKAALLIRDAMNYYLKEKLEKQNTLSSWQPLHVGAVLSDWTDNANREELLDDRY
jgi:hypothetical protein